MSNFIKVTKKGKIFNIQYNRPDKYNAVTREMMVLFTKALQEAAQCKETVITVVSSTGPYFSAGADLANTLNPAPGVVVNPGDTSVQESFIAAHIDHPKPLIALVQGPVVGISFVVLGLFDAVFASEKATFHAPFTQLGIVCESASSYTFPLMMGHSKAAELLVFSQKINAEEAQKRNIVNKVFPADQFEKKAWKFVDEYAKLPPQLIRNDQVRSILHTQLKAECDELKRRFVSDEFKQARDAYVKRMQNNKKAKL